MSVSRSLKWKRRLGRICSLFHNNRMGRRVILIYHSVGGGPLATEVERFRQQMAWLSEHADVVSLDDLLEEKSDNDNDLPKVVLSFDDGYRALHDTVAPILAAYGFPATVYLNSGHIGEVGHEPSDAAAGHYPEETFMTWDEVVALQHQNWMVGSHGVEHLDLTQQPQSVIELELASSKQMIAERMGTPCEHFSYTWGHHNAIVRNAVARAGYRSAVAGLHQPLSAGDDPFRLPRLDIRCDYELADYAAIVLGAWDYLGLYQNIKEIYKRGRLK